LDPKKPHREIRYTGSAISVPILARLRSFAAHAILRNQLGEVGRVPDA
jgi:hypothetical protein